MKLIVGLGNPGERYTDTRHNAGFLAIDNYLQTHSAITCTSKFDAQICEFHEGGTKVFLVKPQTFMNNSGSAVSEISEYYRLNPVNDILIIHDEIDLPIGKIRVSKDSSPAGHNGVKDIFDKLATKNIERLRIGIESRENRSQMPTDAFVLQKFGADEMDILNEKVFSEVEKHIDQFIIKK